MLAELSVHDIVETYFGEGRQKRGIAVVNEIVVSDQRPGCGRYRIHGEPNDDHESLRPCSWSSQANLPM